MFRGFYTIRGAAIAGLIGLATLGNPLPTTAASPAPSDPSIGPNTRQDLAHQHDVLQFAPAHSALIVRQAKPNTTGATTNSAAPAGQLNGTLKREVFGFAPYYDMGNASSWNYSLLSTVAYFGLGLNYDGSLNTAEPGYAGWNSQALADIINNAHTAGDRVVVAIRAIRPDSSHDTAWTVNQIVDPTSGHAQTAITSIINAVNAKSVNGVPAIDGVNIDLEGSSTGYPSVQANFSSFMQSLSQQLKQKWPASQLTVDTYTGSASWDGGIFNIGQLAPSVDGLFIMAYDESFGNLPNQAGANAPLDGWTYNDSLAVSQYISKAPASKVILGVPFYGYKWSTTTDGWDAPIASGGAQAEGYSDVGGDFACAPLLQLHWDYIAQSPWAAWWSPAVNDPCGGNHGSWRELYYDNATSLGIKYDLVNANNLMGAGMWELGFQGTSPDLWPVLADKFETSWPGQYQPLTPARILDTRTSIGGHPGPIGSNQWIDVQVAGAGGVPSSGAAAAIVNVTVVNPTAPSHLIVYPSGAGVPSTSNLNFTAGQTVANLDEVALGANGKLSIYNYGGTTDVIVDVEGWVSTSASLGGAGRFTPVTATRLLDTRTGYGGSRTLGSGASYDLPVTNNAAIPATGVSAVALNLTVTNPTTAGYVSAYPASVTRPNASNVNYVPGLTVPNRVIVPVGAGGKVTVYNCCGSTDLVVDVTGYYTDASASVSGGQFTAVSPVRIADSRIGFGLASAVSTGTTTVSVSGQATVPTGAKTVAINFTVTNPSAAGYMTVFPDGTAWPGTSDVNFTPGKTVANLIPVKIGADGKLSIYNFLGTADVIIDVVGWYN